MKKLKVEPNRKVGVRLAANSAASGTGPTTFIPIEFDFIFGIGTQGLSPFENLLNGAVEGDQVTIEADKSQVPTTFEHLNQFLPDLNTFANDTRLNLQVTIKSVSLVSNQEVVQAIAQQVKCSGGDDCCGSHHFDHHTK